MNLVQGSGSNMTPSQHNLEERERYSPFPPYSLTHCDWITVVIATMSGVKPKYYLLT